MRQLKLSIKIILIIVLSLIIWTACDNINDFYNTDSSSQVATLTFSPAVGTYTSAQTVTISTTTTGSTIWYTTDGSTPTCGTGTSGGTSFTVSVSTTTTINAMACQTGWADSTVVTATYTLQVGTPTFSPAAGTYTSAQTVTISTSTTGSTIWYTTDGSTPACGTGTSGGTSFTVTVSVTTTINAMACQTGYTGSSISSASYIISYENLILSESGLVSYWRLGETSGTTATDSNSTNNGTYTNGVTLGVSGAIVGDSNGAISLDGIDDYVLIPHNANIDFDTNVNFSIELWIKLPTNQVDTGTTYNEIISKWTGTTYPYTIRCYNQISGGSSGIVHVIRFDGTNISNATSTITLNDGLFHHIVFVKDGSTLNLYVDGSLNNSVTDTTTAPTSNTGPINFGRRATGTTLFSGTMDEVAIYNVPLSATQVLQHYNVAKGF